MKTKLIAIGAALLLPAFVFAAYNDVTLGGSSTSVFTINSLTLNVTGTNAVVARATANSDTLVFVLNPGSQVSIASPARATLSHDAASAYISRSGCDADQSVLALSVPTTDIGASITVTITPTSTTCSGSGSASGSGGGGAVASTGGGGGGGGGGGSAAPAPAPTPSTQSATEALQRQIDALLAQAKGLQGTGTSSFTRDLQVGSVGDDVRALQKLLNGKGFTVALSGPGSPGNETGTFGNATKAALAKYQVSLGISPAAGYFGPKTRVAATGSSSSPSTETGAGTQGEAASKGFSTPLRKGMTNSDVLLLQRVLNSNPATAIGTTGVGSPGRETTYFGSLTEKAVGKFQEKYGIAKPGDEGYGRVGPATRAKLNSLLASLPL